MRTAIARRFCPLGLMVLLAVPSGLFAQGGGGGPIREMRRMKRAMEMNTPNAAPAVVNPAENKPAEEKKDDKSAEPKKDDGPKPVSRPPAVENPAARAGQQLAVDDKRMVSFNFQEAPWTFVLEEVAKVSGMNLDWQQLPGDSLNLRSNAKYTIAQARDIINEHLLSRGYAIVVNNKNSTITVLNMDKLNTALVPRVSVEDLENLPPHDLVKVSFRLEWLLAKDAVEELKPMLSPNGKLVALKSMNRVEAIDAVENLRQVAAVLEEEQGGRNGNRLVQEFELRYTRAPEILDQLQVFMGLKKELSKAQKNGPGQQPMMMPQMMQQQPGQQPQQPQGPPKPEIRLMADTRRNTILINAPPDQMAIIKSAIFKMDVPLSVERTTLSGGGPQSYRLATLDPEVVVSFLESIGDLDPQTRLEVDKKNHAVIAYAPPRDQRAIAALVKNLDGSDRTLTVIKLRRLDADLVAGTLRTLLVGEDKNNNNNNSRSRWGWFGGFGSNGAEDTNATKFRIDADVANNRLIVFSNTIELDQVKKCLAELGEAPRLEAGRETLRVLDLGSGREEQELLDRLQRAWPMLGKDKNKLIIDVPKQKKDDDSDKDSEPSKEHTAPKTRGNDAATSRPAVSRLKDVPQGSSNVSGKSVHNDPALGHIHLAGLEKVTPTTNHAVADSGADNPEPPRALRSQRRAIQPGDATDNATAAPEAPQKNAKLDSVETASGAPIYITRGTDGRLVISSRDTQALDALEEMMARLAPPRKEYAVFYLKYATAYSVKLNLDDFFETDKKDKDNVRRPYWWYWENEDNGKKDDSPRLSQRRPLKFIDDSQTNSLMVMGGTPDQLRRVEELIKLYDVPEPQNARVSRTTQPFPIKHSRASVIAEVIKDVYRDLLSANDKALESFNESKNKGRKTEYYGGWGGDREDDGKINQGKFKGLLSVGVDETSNTLIVSCPENLMQSVRQIVLYLDTAAVPVAQTMQVLRIDRAIDAASLQKKLADMLKKQTPQKEQQPQQPGQQGKKKGGGQPAQEANEKSDND